jgi:hypothetical protein
MARWAMQFMITGLMLLAASARLHAAQDCKALTAIEQGVYQSHVNEINRLTKLVPPTNASSHAAKLEWLDRAQDVEVTGRLLLHAATTAMNAGCTAVDPAYLEEMHLNLLKINEILKRAREMLSSEGDVK